MVQPGIDHQTGGAPQLHRESAKVGVRILIKAHFLGEILRVQAPSLAEGGKAGVALEIRHITQLCCD